MYIETSFWSKDLFQFQELLLVRKQNCQSPLIEIDRGDCLIKGSLSSFFSRCEKRQDNQEEKINCVSVCDKDVPYTQFAVIKDGEITPVIWFSIVTKSSRYSHDRAFETTLVTKNGIRLPFGVFYPKKIKSKYRALKVNKAAYRYLSNQLKAN